MSRDIQESTAGSEQVHVGHASLLILILSCLVFKDLGHGHVDANECLSRLT